MFEIRNVRTTVKLIASAEDGEKVYAVKLACETCGLKLEDAPLDLWLAREFPLVVKCSRCGAHMVVNFSELEAEIWRVNDGS